MIHCGLNKITLAFFISNTKLSYLLYLFTYLLTYLMALALALKMLALNPSLVRFGDDAIQ